MVRKHSWYTRARLKRTRPKTRAPSNGWLIADLARITGTSVRSIHYYIARGLIRYLERRGTATRYPRATLIRLLAVPSLQFELKASLAEIKERMDALGEAGLEAWVRARPLSPAARVALGFEATSDGNTAPPVSPGAVRAPIEVESSVRAPGSVETWHRVRLLPGLELMLSADASPIARGAAERIQREFFG